MKGNSTDGYFHRTILCTPAEASFYSPNSLPGIQKCDQRVFLIRLLFGWFTFVFLGFFVYFFLCETIYLLLAKSLARSDKIGHCIENNFLLFFRKRQIGWRYWFLNTNSHAQNHLHLGKDLKCKPQPGISSFWLSFPKEPQKLGWCR